MPDGDGRLAGIMARTYWPECGGCRRIMVGAGSLAGSDSAYPVAGSREMSPAQQRGLALWAALLSAVVCLGFLPVTRLVSVLVLLVLLGLILTFWTVASRRAGHDVTLCLDDLPEATYRQPVVLVCGDLPLAWPQQSPVLTVTQGCWIRVENHQDLEQTARQVLWLRPDWGRQLSVMVSVCPQKHADSEALTSRLLALRWQISQLRKETGHSVPLILNGQVGSAMTNDQLWQAAIPGEGVRSGGNLPRQPQSLHGSPPAGRLRCSNRF